jgi:alpha-tubulin suppressor-like RCC1 family protein
MKKVEEKIATGARHSAAIGSLGHLFVWGSNEEG